MKRVVHERNRKCEGCPWVGDVYLFALGSKSWRVCVPCHSAMERAFVRVVTEGLDAVEVA